MSSDAIENIARILVIRRDNIGDLICTTPLIAALRQKFPQAFIAALVNSYNAAAVANNPHLDEVYTYTKGKHLGPGESQLGALWRRWRLLRRLRRMRFDYAIVAGVPVSGHALRLARAIRPRHIVAAGTDSRIDRPVALAADDGRHEVERAFALGEPLGITGTPPPVIVEADTAERRRAQVQLSDANLPGVGQTVVGVHISARKPSNRWPVEQFAALIRRMHEEHGCCFVIFWAPGAANDPKHPGDDEKMRTLIYMAGNVPLLPLRTETLPELIAGLSLCHYVICSDGGAMHVAAGLGKPIVCLFGDSDVARWGPWGVSHTVLQTRGRDVREVTVDDVIGAFDRLRVGLGGDAQKRSV